MSYDKLMIIDGHSILNRAFFGIPTLTDSKGRHTNAVYGFLNILFKLIEDHKPGYLAVAFDEHVPTFRHEIYKDYKGTRKPMMPELKEQVPLMKEMLKAMDVPVFSIPGIEADDILGTISRKATEKGIPVYIISGDRDLLQLATDTVRVCIPKTKATGTEVEYYYADDVREKYGVSPIEFIDMKAIMGDSSDNIPGVAGIGEKGASKLIGEFHSIENIYDHIEDVKPERTKKLLIEGEESARLSKVLARIKLDCDIT